MLYWNNKCIILKVFLSYVNLVSTKLSLQIYILLEFMKV